MVTHFTYELRGPDGPLGTVASDQLDHRGRAEVELANGRRALVPAEALTLRPDGTVYLPMSPQEIGDGVPQAAAREVSVPDGQAVTIPLAREEITVNKRE